MEDKHTYIATVVDMYLSHLKDKKIYVASKTKYAPAWLKLREHKWNIISTWIDEYEVGDTKNYQDLLDRCVKEIKECDILIGYCSEYDILKGAIGEIAIALAENKRVHMVGKLDCIFKFHKNVIFYGPWKDVK